MLAAVLLTLTSTSSEGAVINFALEKELTLELVGFNKNQKETDDATPIIVQLETFLSRCW